MPSAAPIHLPEEHLHRPVPRHLGELVHRGDQQRRQMAVDLFIHHHHRQPFVGCLPAAERAVARTCRRSRSRPAGALRCTACASRCFLGRSGFRTRGSWSVGRAMPMPADPAYWLPRNCWMASLAVVRPVGRGPLPDPKADAERRLAPAFVPFLQSPTPDDLAGAHQAPWPAGTAGWSTAAACTASAPPRRSRPTGLPPCPCNRRSPIT